MASLSQALRLGDLPPPHRTFQGHATHIREWSMMLRPNDSWSPCIPQGIATFLHYASRRSAGWRYTTRGIDPVLYRMDRGPERGLGWRYRVYRWQAKPCGTRLIRPPGKPPSIW